MLRILILIVALGAGGGAAWIVSQETSPDTAATAPEPVPVGPEMTSVLMAAQEVARGAQVSADALRWQRWPVDAVPAAFIERNAQPNAATELAGLYASRQILPGEPIGNHLLSKTPGGYLAAMLSPGKRAVGISASTQSTAGGFILPNDRVDILHTSENARGGVSGVRTRTIMRGVRVLAIDQTTDDVSAGTVLGKTATLELTETQAEAVTAAGVTGTLSLSLRPREETPGEATLTVMEPPPEKTIRVGRGSTIEDVSIN